MGDYPIKENEFKLFCSKHNERQIYPMRKIIEKYPALRLYGFKTAMKEWTHHHFSHYDIYYCDCDKPCGNAEESCVFNSKTCHAETHHFSETSFYPRFLPDLYLVTDEVILLFEIEDYNPMTNEKMSRIYDWFLECDMEFEPEIIIYGFDRFANFQRIIYNPLNTDIEAMEWLFDLENTPDYKNQDLKKFKLCEDRESLGCSGFKDSIGYCKKYPKPIYNKEEQLKHYIENCKLEHKMKEGSIYY